MKAADIKKLKPNDIVAHTRYGKSKVVKVEYSIKSDLFGLIIEPKTEKGKIQLAADSGSTTPKMLECNYRFIKKS